MGPSEPPDSFGAATSSVCSLSVGHDVGIFGNSDWLCDLPDQLVAVGKGASGLNLPRVLVDPKRPTTLLRLR